MRQKVYDTSRRENGVVEMIYPAGLMKLRNAGGSWLAANENCRALQRKPAAIKRPSGEPFTIPPGTIPHDDMRQIDLRVGDFALFEGRLRKIVDMRGRFGNGRSLIFDNGRVRSANAKEKVYRRL
ncbi:hypothetical protein [Streptomyces sp. H27-H5]|uniref:hypothetical protein n=1 Tax=Streptomyces sp. H27-H5 TaxID=2996460 RepID=UPI00226E3E83|nr:hypothetical protein [Streptomyces sp. H27-H5]MCY0955834.1 hypothetical protein [Streptomyces sp. H27-H5]